VEVILRFEGALNGVFGEDPLTIPLDDKDLEEENVYYSEEQEYKFYVKTEWEGSSKKLTLFQEPVYQKKEEEDSIELQLRISINQIGVSIMDRDHQSRRVELLYITLKKIDFVLVETKTLRTS
jgi:hypothetical protein